MTYEEYDKYEVIFEENEASNDKMYVILDGIVGVYKKKKRNVFENDYEKFTKKDNTMLSGSSARDMFRKNFIKGGGSIRKLGTKGGGMGSGFNKMRFMGVPKESSEKNSLKPGDDNVSSPMSTSSRNVSGSSKKLIAKAAQAFDKKFTMNKNSSFLKANLNALDDNKYNFLKSPRPEKIGIRRKSTPHIDVMGIRDPNADSKENSSLLMPTSPNRH